MDELEINSEYDLDEIESRLYSQVFHGSTKDDIDTGINANTGNNISFPITSKRQNFRYFGSKNLSGNKSSVHITYDSPNQIKECSSIHNNNLTILTPCTTNLNESSNGYQNITVNQYTIPVIIHTDRFQNSWDVESTSHNFKNLKTIDSIENLNLWNSENQVLIKKLKNQLKNKRKKERQKLKQMNKRSPQPKNNKIIFISDDSDDECCVLLKEEFSQSSEIKIDSSMVESNVNIEESDDDVIYIPPPPIELINLDDDEHEKEIPKSQTINECQIDSSSLQSDHISLKNKEYHPIERKELVSTPESISNDFLDNSNIRNISTNFNFGLHGADFNSSSDFARPSTPLDFCETESSCSTNDQNKDFNNSAKSIVFDEVEFPKDDIFGDKNLDNFSSFITPKRNTKNPAENSCTLAQGNEAEDSESSESSTESDYELLEIGSEKQCRKRLPMLSPMINDLSPKLQKNKDTGTNKFSMPTKKLVKERKLAKREHLKGQLKNKISKRKNKISKISEDSSKKSNNGGELLEEIENSEIVEEVDNIVKKKTKKSSDFLENQNEYQNEDFVTEECNPSGANTSYGSADENDELTKNKKRLKKSRKSDYIVDKVKIRDTITLSDDSSTNINLNITTQDENNTLVATECIDDIGNGSKNLNDEYLDVVTDPNDINLYNETSGEINGTVDVQQTDGEDEIDVVVIDQKENDLPDVIVLEDVSDSDVEVIDVDTIDSTMIQLANCATTTAPNTVATDSFDNLDSFDVKVIQSKQSDDPQKWLISYSDRNTSSVPKRKGIRCNRCRRNGHIGARCPEKPYPQPCSLCSDTNHQEPRCPYKVCRQCGNRGDYSISYCYICFKYRHLKCNLCYMPGHLSNTCPDLWRRYHLTIDDGPIVVPKDQVMRPRNQQWCSGCAQQGHLEHECINIHYHREFPPTRPDIITYIDVRDNIQSEIAHISRSVPKPVVPVLPLYNFPSPLNDLITIDTTTPNLGLGRTDAPNTVNSDIVQVSNLVPNPYVLPNSQQNLLVPNLLEQMRSNFQNSTSRIDETKANELWNSSKYDIKKIRELFMSMPHATIKSFLKRQVDELDTKIVNCNPRILRHQLFKYDRIAENLNEKMKKGKYYWFRVLNMFIFGIHGLNDGRLHIRFLKNFLASRKSHEFDESRRRSLFNSYSYIFSGNKHTYVNYYKMIKLLTHRYPEKDKVSNHL